MASSAVEVADSTETARCARVPERRGLAQPAAIEQALAERLGDVVERRVEAALAEELRGLRVQPVDGRVIAQHRGDHHAVHECTDLLVQVAAAPRLRECALEGLRRRRDRLPCPRPARR